MLGLSSGPFARWVGKPRNVPKGAPKGRILLISDHAQLPHFAKANLRVHKFEVDLSTTLEEAFTTLGLELHDFVIVDVCPRKMSMFEVYKHLTAFQHDFRIAFATPFEIRKEEFEIMFPTLNIAYFVVSPLTVEKLAELIRHEYSLPICLIRIPSSEGIPIQASSTDWTNDNNRRSRDHSKV